MLVKMAVPEYFIIINFNFQIKLPVKNLFPIHSGVDFSRLHITAMGIHGTHLSTTYKSEEIPVHCATDVLALQG